MSYKMKKSIVVDKIRILSDNIPPYVTCHSCGGRGHLKHECLDILKKIPTNSWET